VDFLFRAAPDARWTGTLVYRLAISRGLESEAESVNVLREYDQAVAARRERLAVGAARR
jgi:hypothetical protein